MIRLQIQQGINYSFSPLDETRAILIFTSLFWMAMLFHERSLYQKLWLTPSQLTWHLRTCHRISWATMAIAHLLCLCQSTTSETKIIQTCLRPGHGFCIWYSLEFPKHHLTRPTLATLIKAHCIMKKQHSTTLLWMTSNTVKTGQNWERERGERGRAAERRDRERSERAKRQIVEKLMKLELWLYQQLSYWLFVIKVLKQWPEVRVWFITVEGALQYACCAQPPPIQAACLHLIQYSVVFSETFYVMRYIYIKSTSGIVICTQYQQELKSEYLH